MPVLSYFTLPFGQPIDGQVRVVPEGSELLCDVLSAVDTDGAYQLYQCVEEAGQIYCVVPVCRVSKPLMPAPLKVYLDTSAISSKMTPRRRPLSPECFGKRPKASNFKFTYPT